MGIGKNRNKPCSCGSGIKEKKCHPEGLNDAELVELQNKFRDPISQDFINYNHTYKIQIENFRNQKYADYINFVIATIGGSTQGELAAEKIETVLATIVPERIKQILASRNIYHWIALDRRISPKDGITRHFEKSTWSTQLAKFYMNNIFNTFSSFKLYPNEVLAQEFSYLPLDYMTIYEVEILGVVLQEIGLLKRIVSKGGSIEITNSIFATRTSPLLRKTLDFYDLQNKTQNDWAGLIGLMSPFTDKTNSSSELLNGLFLVCIGPNGGDQTIIEYAGCTMIEPHCFPQKIDIDEVYNLTGLLEKYFINQTGIDLMTWLKCFSEISSYILSGDTVNVFTKLFKYGYSISDKASILGLHERHPELTPKDLQKFLLHATKSNEKLTDHADLHLLNNKYFISEISQNQILIDGYLIKQYFTRTLIDAYKAVAHQDDIGRGLILEIQANHFTKSAGFKTYKERGFKFRKNAETLIEADLSISKKGKLGILDCKSLIADIDAKEGSFSKVNQRVEKIRSLLRQRDIRSETLANNPSGDNYTLSDQVCYAQLLSADVEWLPPEDEFLWWAEGIPRVCTAETFLRVVLPYLSVIENHIYFYKIQ